MAKTIVLDSTAKSLAAFTASSSGAAIDYVTAWAESTATSFTEGETDGQLTSSTPVTIVSAPASSTRRVIKTINLYNAGAFAEAVTIALVNGANTRVLYKITIQPGVSWTSDDVTTFTTPVGSAVSFRNVLVNGDFQVSQRTPPLSFSSGIANEYLGTGDYTTLSTSYTHDRWVILHSNAAAQFSVARSTDVPGGQVNSCVIRPLVTTAGKFGLLQIVEANNTAPLRGNPATLSFWAKRDATPGTQITNVKASIVQWSGTADAMPRKIVNAWNATGAAPTYITNITNAATPVTINVTDVWNQFSLTVPTIAGQNVAVFIWNDRTDNLTTDRLFLADVQLERGLVATPFEVLPLSASLARCYRYFYSAWGGVVNGAAVDVNSSYGPVNLQTSPTNGREKVFRGSILFPQQMRTTPTGLSKGTPSIPAYRVIDSVRASLGAIDRPAILTTSTTQLEFTVNSAIITTLAAAIPASTATISIAVNSTAALPSVGTVKIGSEYINYTGINMRSDAYTTVLSAAITTTGAISTINVSNASAFLEAGSLIINAEIFDYTGKTATTFTGVTRARNGTTATTHLNNATVKQAVFLTGCLRAQSGSTAASAGVNTTVNYRFNNLTAGTYELQHSGTVPSFFHANAEL
jgi:hypothetical protein